MSCYAPLLGVRTGVINPETGKEGLKVYGHRSRPDLYEMVKVGDSYEWRLKVNLVEHPEYVPLPCGHCIGCRLDYSRRWANRCMLELKTSESAYFLTLTYDDEHVNINSQGHLTLYKRDLQLFWKRLRKYFENDNIRYFACGEYGDTTLRPHYHAIVYNLNLTDLQMSGKSEFGDIYYRSDTLDSIWKNGFVCVGDVTWETCAYTARYVMKKLTGKLSDFYDTFELEPEFCVMSRRPGIGYEYYAQHKYDLLEFTSIPISTASGVKNISIPKYYKDKLCVDNPAFASYNKDRDMIAGMFRAQAIDRQTDLESHKYLQQSERLKLQRKNVLSSRLF